MISAQKIANIMIMKQEWGQIPSLPQYYPLQFLFLFILAVLESLWEPSSLTRDSNQALSHKSAESYPLNSQGIPPGFFLIH